MRNPEIEAVFVNTNLIRSTLQAPNAVASDADLPDLMDGVCADVRSSLITQWRFIATMSPWDFAMSTGAFKDAALNLLLTGVSRKDVPRVNVGTACLEWAAECGRYVYEFNQPLDLFAIQALSAAEVLALFATDIVQGLQDSDNYASITTFDRAVVCKMIALFSAIEAAGGNLNGDSGGGQESTAPVPRSPEPPQIIGSAEEQLPVPIESAMDLLDSLLQSPGFRPEPTRRAAGS